MSFRHFARSEFTQRITEGDSAAAADIFMFFQVQKAPPAREVGAGKAESEDTKTSAPGSESNESSTAS